jgi:hypothetical protein
LFFLSKDERRTIFKRTFMFLNYIYFVHTGAFSLTNNLNLLASVFGSGNRSRSRGDSSGICGFTVKFHKTSRVKFRCLDELDLSNKNVLKRIDSLAFLFDLFSNGFRDANLSK